VSQFHRSIESTFTGVVLKAIFSDDASFAHHAPLPAAVHFSDEGAANHTRLCTDYAKKGIELFVYGRRASSQLPRCPLIFPARQTLEASEAMARLHQLDPSSTVFAQQNPAAIDAGVFHNDVISVGNQGVFVYHADAFGDSDAVIGMLKKRFAECCDAKLCLIKVGADEVTVQEAVESYLFNSQLVTLPDGGMCLIAPVECEENPRTKKVLDRIIYEENPIRAVRFVDVRQSMKNGGGPACLRLRVVLTEEEMGRTHQNVYLTDLLFAELTSWGEQYYRDQLSPADLADPALAEEGRAALDVLTQILKLGSIYRFQKSGA
jgi:succinylarginine dihydrolase